MLTAHTPSSCSSWNPWRVRMNSNKLELPHFNPQCRRGRATCVVASSEPRSFKVTLQTPSGEKIIEAAEDVYVLDAAESVGVSLPVSCRSGNCSSCAAVLKSGQVDQSNQVFLDDDQVSQGFILTCVAYPLSDIVVETHQESRLYT